MSQPQTIVYTARTLQDAHLLRNLLAEQRIEAVVLNELLEGGSGVSYVGWQTAAQVVVAEEDAQRARQIAVRFDRRQASSPGMVQGEPLPHPPPTVPDRWPRCPECDAPRSTRCPVCGTTGSEFPPADMGFTWIPELEDTAWGSPVSSCGPGGCAPVAATGVGGGDEATPEAPAAGEAAAGQEPDAAPAMLMCPTCDEPFTPEYPRRCEWCGHEFADGVEIELRPSPVGQVNRRVIAVVMALLALAVALAAYFMFLV